MASTPRATVEAAAEGASLPLFDAHCHLQLPRLLAQAPDVVAAARRSGVGRAAVCGCEPADWGQVARLAEEHPDFVAPQFGVHPWWAPDHEEPARWAEALEALLVEHPGAGVGECGLDGARKKTIPMELQLGVLRPQLQLAKRLQRPVSLHAVACHGALLSALQEAFGKGGHNAGLVLHSYCGSADMVQPLARLNCFFSFGASILHIEKHRQALQRVPLERLLLETDSPDQLPRDLSEGGPVPPEWRAGLAAPRRDGEGPLNEPAWLPAVLAGAAEALGLSPDELGKVTAANARRVFDFA